jgi:long-chain acyl-CoA synthetase
VDPESHRDLPAGERGEIVIRGPNVMAGYWRRPEETGQAIRGGWLHSGDIGWLDEEGYLYVVDRLKDMINTGGLKIWPAEVENALSGHAAVLECAVYGVPDPVMGEQVRAAIVRRPNAQTDYAEIRAYCRPRLAEYKIPVAIEFRGALPKTPSGKVLKRVLRREAAAQGAELGRNGEAKGRDAIAWRTWIVDWLAPRLDVPRMQLRPQSSFADLGVSSILAVQLAREAAAESGTPLEATALWRYPAIGALAQAIANLQATGVPASRALAAGGSRLP